MDTLPPEIVWHVLEHADALTRAVCGCVNSEWRQTALGTNKAHRKRRPFCGVCRIRDQDGTLSECLTPRRCAILFAQKALAHRRWTLFEWMVERTMPIEGPNEIDRVACTVAVEDGDLERLNVLVKTRGYRTGSIDVSTAVGRYGRLAVLEWLDQESLPWYMEAVLCEAIRSAHDHVIEWAIQRRGWKHLPKVAARCGRRDLIERMVASEGKEAIKSRSWATEAARGGSVDVLAWLVENGCQWDAAECCQAGASGNHLAVVHWVMSNSPDRTLVAGVLMDASARGHLKTIERFWIEEHRNAIGTTCMEGATVGGHVHVLDWLKEHGCYGSAELCAIAAELGHVGALEWLLGQGLTWDLSRSIESIISRGQMNVLLWEEARRKKDMDEQRWIGNDIAEVLTLKAKVARLSPEMASSDGKVEILQWLHRHGILDVDKNGSDMCVRAARNGHMGIIAWLYSLGCKLDMDRCASIAASNGDTDLLAWLAQHGCVFGASTVYEAIAAKRYGTAEWLRARGAP